MNIKDYTSKQLEDLINGFAERIYDVVGDTGRGLYQDGIREVEFNVPITLVASGKEFGCVRVRYGTDGFIDIENTMGIVKHFHRLTLAELVEFTDKFLNELLKQKKQ